MTRNSQVYWEQRQAQDMYRYMDNAENIADQIAQVYLKASRQLSFRADEVFEKYQSKHGLSESEARRLVNELHSKESIEELLRALRNGSADKTKKELLAELEAPAYQARLERLRQIQNQLDLLMQAVYQQEKDFSTSFYADLAQESYYRGIYNIQQRAGVGFPFAHINAKQIDSAFNSRWSGANYSERIWRNTAALADALKEELIISLLTGKTNRETANIIASKFAQGSSNARRLVRTESNFLSSEMNFRAYEASGIEKYQYLATLDLKTSLVCRKLDGNIYLVKERVVGVNCPPMHPWCRSTTISVISEELMEKMQRSAIDPATGKRILVPRTMTYDQWYEKFVKGRPEIELEEKKIRNMSADKVQHRKYQEILGRDIPGKLDDYQKMKYNEPEKWKYTKLDYQRRNKLLQHPELRLPNAENAIAAEAKFTKYLFAGDHPEGLAKGAAFKSRLGYDLNNWQNLQREILSRALKYPTIYKGNNGYADMYEQKIIINGLKGTPANVVVGWSIGSGKVTMASAYIKEV